MPIKKFHNVLSSPNTPQRGSSGTKSPNQKNLKAPNAEPKATPPLTLRNRTPNGGLLAEPIPNSSEPTKRYNRDYLKDRWQTLSGRMMDWLHQGNRLEDMMAETKLRDIGVMLGIATEKVLLLEGQPTSIIGQAESKKLEDLIPALLLEVKRRGIKADVTERKVSLEVPPNV